MKLLTQLKEATAYLKSKDIKDADAGIVLGTGLNGLVDHIEIIETIPYHDIPSFSRSHR